MFTVGRSYYVTMWVTAAEGTHSELAGVVLEVQMPLVKFRNAEGAETIVNTSSAAFIGARLAED